MSGIFSKSELGVMSIAFSTLFNVNKEIAMSKTVEEWMESAPRLLVEFEGFLKNEDSSLQSVRMEMNEAAYNGNVTELVKHLRRLYSMDPVIGNKPKWELIFHVANEIMSVQETIQRATAEVMMGTSSTTITETEVEDTTKVEQTEEVQQVETSTSTVETEPELPETVEEVPTVTDTVDEINDNLDVEVKTDEAVSSGNVEVEDTAQSLFDKTDNVTEDVIETKSIDKMEETKMAENAAFQNLMEKAQGAVPQTQAGSAPAASNVESSKEDKRFQDDVAQLLKERHGNLIAWGNDNRLTFLVSTQLPAKFRRINNATSGRVFTKGTAAENQTAATEKLNNFISNISGGKATDVTSYAALSDADKYYALNNQDDVKKAAAIYDLLTKLANDPEGTYEAFIPADSDVNYPVKGFTLGEKSYTMGQTAVILLDKTTGTVYAEGFVNEKGDPTEEKAPAIELAVAKKTETNKNTEGVEPGKRETKKLVVRPKNKKKFLEAGAQGGGVNKKIKFLKNELAFDGEGTDRKPREGKASFKAAIVVDGITMGATLAYRLTDDKGQFIEREKTGTATPSTKKTEDKPSYKTAVFSVNVSIPVQEVEPEIAVEFLDDKVDDKITYEAWGIRKASQKVLPSEIKNGSDMPLFNVFTKIGVADLKNMGVESELVKALINKSKENAEADAAAAQNELD